MSDIIINVDIPDIIEVSATHNDLTIAITPVAPIEILLTEASGITETFFGTGLPPDPVGLKDGTLFFKYTP